MTALPQSPSRRRRLLIAITLLVSVALAAWRFTPRGDAGFVGTWSMSEETKPEMGELALLSSGLGRWSNPGFPGSTTFPWHFDGEHLVLGNESEGQVTRAIQVVSNWIHQLTSHEFAYGDGEEPYRVLRISADEIRLEDPSSQSKFILRRVRD